MLLSCGFELTLQSKHTKTMNNAVLQAIRERRSIRKYQDRQISDEELRAVLEAGTFAPTGKNLQDPYIVAVQQEEMKQQIIRMNAAVMDTTSNPFYDAPTLVLVFGPTEWRNYIQDGSLVLGTMMLAAHSIGLASCWINREIEMFQTPEGKTLMQRMGLPEGLGGIGALSLGYAAVPAAPARPRKIDYFRIIK